MYLCFSVQNVQILKDPEAVKQLGNILKTNVRACKALGHPYVLQVGVFHSCCVSWFQCQKVCLMFVLSLQLVVYLGSLWVALVLLDFYQQFLKVLIIDLWQE